MGGVNANMMTFAALFLLAISFCLSSAEQCLPKTGNPCRFDCNGTEFDISHVFDYPYNIDSDFQFTWCPCKGCICEYSKGPLAAVCQSGYNAGQLQDPVFILERTDPYLFTIEYTSGLYWRISIFKFMVSEEYPKPNIVFTGADNPILQYNFQVTGKCLGQPDCKTKGPNPFH